MKSVLLTFLLLTAGLVPTLSSQLSIGIKSGFVRAWQQYGDIDLPENTKIHVNRFQFAFLASLPIGSAIDLNFEPGYAQRGAACFPGYENLVTDTKMMFNYIDFPITIQAHHAFPGNTWTVYGKAGYGVSKMVSGSRVTVDNSTGEMDKVKLDMQLNNNPFRKWDTGVYTGLGFDHKVGSVRLLAEMNYYFGLLDVDKSNTTKNRDLSLNLGFTVPFL